MLYNETAKKIFHLPYCSPCQRTGECAQRQSQDVREALHVDERC